MRTRCALSLQGSEWPLCSLRADAARQPTPWAGWREAQPLIPSLKMARPPQATVKNLSACEGNRANLHQLREQQQVRKPFVPRLFAAQCAARDGAIAPAEALRLPPVSVRLQTCTDAHLCFEISRLGWGSSGRVISMGSWRRQNVHAKTQQKKFTCWGIAGAVVGCYWCWDGWLGWARMRVKQSQRQASISGH